MEGVRGQESFETQFARFEKFWNSLKEKGFDMFDLKIVKENLECGKPVPVVHDGIDGARAYYRKSTGIKIWYTNSFENPDNPKRKEIEVIWTEINK